MNHTGTVSCGALDPPLLLPRRHAEEGDAAEGAVVCDPRDHGQREQADGLDAADGDQKVIGARPAEPAQAGRAVVIRQVVPEFGQQTRDGGGVRGLGFAYLELVHVRTVRAALAAPDHRTGRTDPCPRRRIGPCEGRRPRMSSEIRGER
jgi:hypothetical protein